MSKYEIELIKKQGKIELRQVGRPGISAYQVALQNGFEGTEEEWLESLIGPKGDDGRSAYEVAVDEGFVGTIDQWLASLKGEKGDQGDPASNIVTSVQDRVGDVIITKSDLNIEQVDNTADIDKPVSNPVQAALDLKEDKSNRGNANGYAPLNGSVQLPSAYLQATGVTAATYGSASKVVQFAVDAKGRITTATEVDIVIPQASVSGLVTDLAAKAADNSVVHLTGNESINGIKTFTSSPVVPTPTGLNDAVNKLYVDSQIASVEGSDVDSFNSRTGAVVPVSGDYTAAMITNVPTGNIAAITVQAAINELDSEKEPVISAGTTAQYWRGDKSWQTLNAAAVGLGNVTNVQQQPLDATLTALAAYNTNGIIVQTAADTFTGRTITGTANQVTVTNGNGVAGNPTLSLPQNIHTGATPTFSTITATGGQSQFANVSMSTVQTIVLTMTNTATSGSGGGAGIVSLSNDGAALASGDRMGFLLFGGNYDATNSYNSAGIVLYTTQDWSSAARGSMIAFEYTANGATARRQGVRIGDSAVLSTLYVVGDTTDSTMYALRLVNAGAATELFNVRNDGAIGIRTNAPTHTLTLASTATGMTLYNTSDQTTNTERVRNYWNSGTYTVATEALGTGIIRPLFIGSGSIGTTYAAGASTKISHSFGSSGLTSVSLVNHTGTMNASSGVQWAYTIAPTISQSNTAGYTAFLVNPTESSVGSGAKLLIDLQVGGSSKFSVSNTGKITSILAQTYNATNVTTDRAYDANSTTIDELADVLGTLIADLRTLGVVN